MSIKIPSHFDFGIDLNGIPTDYSVAVTQLPKINVGIDPLEFKVDPLEIKVDPLEIRPLDVSFRIKEIPSVRVHLPVDYKVGFALFGAELACVHLCGQGQVITEPYVPNPCECQPGSEGTDVPRPNPARASG